MYYIIRFIIQIICILIAVAYNTLLERKIMAFLQRRRGPLNVGLGLQRLLQSLAYSLTLFAKLFAKEIIIPIKANKNLIIVALILFVLFVAFLQYNLTQTIAFLNLEFERTMAMDRLLDAERRWYENYLDRCATENLKQWEIENAKQNQGWIRNIVCSIQEFIKEIERLQWKLSAKAYMESHGYSKSINWDSGKYNISLIHEPFIDYNNCLKNKYYGQYLKEDLTKMWEAWERYTVLITDNACNIRRQNLDSSFFNCVGINNALSKLLPPQFELLAHLNHVAINNARHMVNLQLDNMHLPHTFINKASVVNSLLLDAATNNLIDAINSPSVGAIEAAQIHLFFVESCINVQSDICTRQLALVDLLKTTQDINTLNTCVGELSFLHDRERWLRVAAPKRFREYLSAISAE